MISPSEWHLYASKISQCLALQITRKKMRDVKLCCVKKMKIRHTNKRDNCAVHLFCLNCGENVIANEAIIYQFFIELSIIFIGFLPDANVQNIFSWRFWGNSVYCFYFWYILLEYPDASYGIGHLFCAIEDWLTQKKKNTHRRQQATPELFFVESKCL